MSDDKLKKMEGEGEELSLDKTEQSANRTERDLKDMTWETPDGSFTKKILKVGSGFIRPLLESVCVLDVYSQTSDQSEKDKDDVSTLLSNLGISEGKCLELKLGMAETQAMKILELCLMTMKKGEESEFIIKRPQDLWMQSDVEKSHSPLCLVLTLRDFCEVKPLWELSSDDKYQLAIVHKERGTNLFKDGKIEPAFYHYSIAVKYLICIYECSSVIDDEPEPDTKSHKQEYLALECICYLNLAACQSKVANHHSVIDNCTRALELESSNVKGLYRRAQAYKACGKLEQARSDLKRAMKIEPKNRAIASLLASCKK